VWEKVDALAAMHNVAERKDKEKTWGIKYNEHGLLLNRSLRNIHKPIQHYIRDWMHTFVSGGVANIHTGQVLHHLQESHNVKQDIVQTFALQCVLPIKYLAKFRRRGSIK
jgi:hypothetical protein